MSPFNDFVSSVPALVDAASAVSPLVKISWMVVLVWAVIQGIWYRRLRIAAPPPIVEVPRPPRPRPAKKPADTPAPPRTTGDLLADLGVQVHGSPGPLDSAYR